MLRASGCENISNISNFGGRNLSLKYQSSITVKGYEDNKNVSI